MRVLWSYLQPHRGLVVLSLLLAGTSQVLALVDPIIFGRIIDNYATPPYTLPADERVKGALWLMLLAVVVALLSRLAKAFQEYFTNLVVQKFGVQIFNDGLKQTLKLSYQEYADQNSSEIYYNGTPVKEIWLNEARRQLGFVTQETNLFSGTIKENLQYVKPDATDEEIIAAMQKASCTNLLTRSDKGIYSQIGEGGLKMSGGEKQRLSIARALIRNPRLLIFDEATSALDSLTEKGITATVKEISALREQITILIAHRLSTIMHADTIYVLERGKIVEQGTHVELVEQKGLYYAMWRQQIGERKVELIR